MSEHSPIAARTRDEAITNAARVYSHMRATCAQMTPREQAEAAYAVGGPSVDELEDRIRIRRGLAPIHTGGRWEQLRPRRHT